MKAGFIWILVHQAEEESSFLSSRVWRSLHSEDHSEVSVKELEAYLESKGVDVTEMAQPFTTVIDAAGEALSVVADDRFMEYRALLLTAAHERLSKER